MGFPESGGYIILDDYEYIDIRTGEVVDIVMEYPIRLSPKHGNHIYYNRIAKHFSPRTAVGTMPAYLRQEIYNFWRMTRSTHAVARAYKLSLRIIEEIIQFYSDNPKKRAKEEPEKLREYARLLYIENKSMKEIRQILGRSYITIHVYIKRRGLPPKRTGRLFLAYYLYHHQKDIRATPSMIARMLNIKPKSLYKSVYYCRKKFSHSECMKNGYKLYMLLREDIEELLKKYSD